jgi:c(7)-type cytochrome triheme protein
MNRRVRTVLASVALAVIAAGTARAVPPGFTLRFDGNGEGEVLFAGATHSGKGMHCSNCHFELFDVSRSSQIKRADHRRSRFCFACHDGTHAFAPRSNCDRCHADTETPLTDPVAVPAGVSTPGSAPR